MPIEFRCTGCGKLLRTPDNTGGKQARCPECGTVGSIPARTSSAASVTPAAHGNQSRGERVEPVPDRSAAPSNPAQVSEEHESAPEIVGDESRFDRWYRLARQILGRG